MGPCIQCGKGMYNWEDDPDWVRRHEKVCNLVCYQERKENKTRQGNLFTS